MLTEKEHDMLRVLGYTLDQFEVISKPYWLASSETWDEALEEGYLEYGALRPHIPREGSYFNSYRLSHKGMIQFNILLERFHQSSK